MSNEATKIGLDWKLRYDRMYASCNNWTELVNDINMNMKIFEVSTPLYYKKRFHGYENGNLCIEAAIEQDILSKVVGSRNYPKEGLNAETIFRRNIQNTMIELGISNNTIPQGSVIVDLGCGSGISTRHLARHFDKASKIIGIDLSPYMVAVAMHLSKEATISKLNDLDIADYDPRIEYYCRDIAETKLNAESVDVVNIEFVLHELPYNATLSVLKEANRILKPGGSIIISEMNPDSPTYQKFRSKAIPFAIMRSTEPYLDEYFDLVSKILPNILIDDQYNVGFSTVKVTAATPRHFVMVATKKGISMDDRLRDLR